MARIRTIKPEFWTDEKVVELSPLARLLFIGLWNFADDDGRMVHSPMRIKLQVLPADSIDISALLGELRGKLLIDIYSVDGQEYLQIVKWTKHQKVDKRTPSKFPSPQRGTPIPAEFPRIPTTEGIKEGIKERKGETTSAPDASRPRPDKIDFDFAKGQFLGITEDQELAWQEAFPAVPIPPAIAQAAAWLSANPANRKSNYKRFLVNWFSRAQERAPRVRA